MGATGGMRRLLLLSTTVLIGALAGYGRGAYGQSCVRVPGTATFDCADTGSAGVRVDADGAAVRTVDRFRVEGSNGPALRITGDGPLSFRDERDDTVLRSAEYGAGLFLRTYDYGGYGGEYGEYVSRSGGIEVVTGARIDGASTGLSADSRGAGDVRIVVTGDVRGRSSDGIYANVDDGSARSNLTIEAATVRGGRCGHPGKQHGRRRHDHHLRRRDWREWRRR